MVEAANSQAAFAQEPSRRSARTKAGKGGAAEQLEKCADAITHGVAKRARNDVPSDESVNPMAPRTSPRKRRRHVIKQPKRSSDANNNAATGTVSSNALPTYLLTNALGYH